MCALWHLRELGFLGYLAPKVDAIVQGSFHGSCHDWVSMTSDACIDAGFASVETVQGAQLAFGLPIQLECEQASSSSYLQ